MPDGIVIRALEQQDLAACAAALVPSYLEPPYDRRITDAEARALLVGAIAREPGGCWVALAGRAVAGGLLAHSTSADGSGLSVTELFVVAEFRRQGIARALIDRLRAQWPDARSIGLLVDRRAPAYDVYKRLGFKESPGLAPMIWTAE